MFLQIVKIMMETAPGDDGDIDFDTLTLVTGFGRADDDDGGDDVD